MNHHTGLHLVLSKAKGGISIIAQFSFPLKSNEFFRNCRPTYATIKLSPPKLNTVRPSQSSAISAITSQGGQESLSSVSCSAPSPGSAQGLLWARRGRGAEPCMVPIPSQARLRLPLQGCHPWRCTITVEFAAGCGKGRAPWNRREPLRAVLHRLPCTPEPQMPSRGEPSGTVTQAGGTRAATEESQDGLSSTSPQHQPFLQGLMPLAELQFRPWDRR